MAFLPDFEIKYNERRLFFEALSPPSYTKPQRTIRDFDSIHTLLILVEE